MPLGRLVYAAFAVVGVALIKKARRRLRDDPTSVGVEWALIGVVLAPLGLIGLLFAQCR